MAKRYNYGRYCLEFRSWDAALQATESVLKTKYIHRGYILLKTPFEKTEVRDTFPGEWDRETVTVTHDCSKGNLEVEIDPTSFFEEKMISVKI